MALETIPFSELERQTTDTFEAIAVMSKRARQINAERLAKMELPAFMDDVEEDGGWDREDLKDIDFDAIEKPTTFAVREMLAGDLTFRYKESPVEASEDEDAKVGKGSGNSE